MNRSLAFAAAALATFVATTPLVAQNSTTTGQRSAPSGDSVRITRRTPPPERGAVLPNFTGRVSVEPLFDSIASSRASGASVSFEAGARTAWHSHSRGQMLIVTAGVGRVQQWGAPLEEIRPGDVVRIPPNVKHWHGAAPATAMTHIAVAEGSTQWMEQVTEVQFNATVRTALPPF
jgi:4-carboxymuconolactone decarboxylase